MWDDVPDRVEALGVDIPELISGPLVEAMPELQNLAKYGGKSLEDNIKAASIRYSILKKKMQQARVKASTYRSNLGTNFADATVSLDWGSPIASDQLGILAAKIDRSRDTRKVLSRFLDNGTSTAELAKLLEFLRSDDPNVSPEDTLAKILNDGVVFKTNNGPIGSVQIPFKTDENGLVVPAVDLASYRGALTSLGDYSSNRILPSNIGPGRVSLKVAATQSDFESLYKKISPTARDLSRTQGVNFTLRPDGTEIQRSTDLNGSINDKTSLIVINHEFSSASTPEFGSEGNDAVAETIYHEYAHTVHRSMGIGWGDETSANPGLQDYAPVQGQSVSTYGDKNGAKEHFAETFAKYIATGSATPEFLDFLKNKVGIKDFDIDSVYPEIFRGTNIVKSFKDWMGSVDLSGWRVSITGNSSIGQYSNEQLKNLPRSSDGSLPSITASFSGRIYDQQNRDVGEFGRTVTRESDGSITVSHDIFRLNDDAQGTGFGNSFIQKSFKLYKEQWKAKTVKVHAALTNGPYMWALQGFDFNEKTLPGQRKSRHELAKDYAMALEEYNNLPDSSKSKDSSDVAKEIVENLEAKGKNFYQVGQINIRMLIEAARQNGWNIDNNFINELMYLAKLNTGDVTANMIAELGRKNKKSSDKTSSSIGRYIMMNSHWYGILGLEQWQEKTE